MQLIGDGDMGDVHLCLSITFCFRITCFRESKVTIHYGEFHSKL